MDLGRREFITGGLAALATCVLPSISFGRINGFDPEWQDESSSISAAASHSVQPTYCKGVLRLSSSLRRDAKTFEFRDVYGNYDRAVIAEMNWFLRCADNTWQYMDAGVLESLNYMSKALNDPLILIHSGYRSPAYNAKLSKHNENVARNSLHMYGRAIDFSIPGIHINDVCSYALMARNTIGKGGVGFYSRKGFVHLDSGPTRQWSK